MQNKAFDDAEADKRAKAVSYTHLDVYKRQVNRSVSQVVELVVADGNRSASICTVAWHNHKKLPHFYIFSLY